MIRLQTFIIDYKRINTDFGLPWPPHLYRQSEQDVTLGDRNK